MKYTSTQNKSRINLIILIVLLLVIGIWEIFYKESSKGFLWIPPNTNHTASKPALWTRSDIFTDNRRQPLIIALKNTVVVLGTDDSKQRAAKVMAFSADSGKMLWKKNFDGKAITSTNSSIIVGGSLHVLALNYTNGETLWKTFVQANVNRLYVVGDVLYIGFAASSHYYILDITNGDILEKATGSIPLWADPFYREDIFYIRKTGDGAVFDDYQLVNIELWRSMANGVGNLVITEHAIYILDKEGYLLQLDPATGSSKRLIQFTPSIFIYGEETLGSKYPYYIAVDTYSNTLFIFLGDSAQLFAFQLP